MSRRWATAAIVTAVFRATVVGGFEPIPQAFEQEVALHREPGSRPAGVVHAFDRDGKTLRALVTTGWLVRDESGWRPAPGLETPPGGRLRVATADGVVEFPVAPREVAQVARSGDRVWVVAADRLFESMRGGMPRELQLPAGAVPRQVAIDGAGWLAASNGLFREHAGDWEAVAVVDDVGRDWAAGEVLAVTLDAAGNPWIATRAGVARRAAAGWTCFDGGDGLPWNEFTSAAGGLGGDVWFATRRGVIRHDADGFHYRQGPRWLPHDDVRRVAVDGDGDAWMITEGGLGRIGRRRMTLAEKAAHYEAEIERYVARTPFGFVAEARLRTAGDRASADPQDSDNDGLWTAMYGAGECFAFAATGSPESLRRARRAFEALRFLQAVTQQGTPPAAPGFVARTIRPASWPDPNVGGPEADRAQRLRDPLWKDYAPRWPRSADGAWYWKGDTSSDELDGHFFFYPLYHDLCAVDETEKRRVREVVRGLVDHLLAHGLALVDVDGRPTRWAVFGPERLNASPDWWGERGLNSLSILSYLSAAAHVTGDARYHDAADRLVRDHGYAQNMMAPKVQLGPGSGNQSDDEMAVMCLYNLVRHARDPDLVNRARTVFFQYWVGESAERNPFFHVAHAAANLGQSVDTTWGRVPVSPWDWWLADARATLVGFPLDRLNWPQHNSHRLDVVPLEAGRARDLHDPDAVPRGHLVDGKVLPIENRHVVHWNTDPWQLDYGGAGDELAAGTVFLLPYYMGLHHGFVARP